MIKDFCHYPSVLITGLLLLLLSTNVFADNLSSSCFNTTVNDVSNTCYTITPPLVDASGFTIDGNEMGGEWTGAKSKNLIGNMDGSFKVLRSADAVYLLITVNDVSYNASDRIRVFFDVLHSQDNTTDDNIEFRVKRDTGGSPNHQKITSSGTTTWNPAALGSELGVSSGASAWTIELKLTASELGVSDLPPIIGFAIEAESPYSGDLTSWPSEINSDSPSTWANLKTRYPIKYMIVLDRSGSMLSQNKWNDAKKAANFLANTMAILQDAKYFVDSLGVTTFSWSCSGNTNETTTPKPLAPIAAFPLGNYIDAAQPVGSPLNCTPIGKGLDEAFTALGTGAEETQRVVLLLSDGLHNEPNGYPASESDQVPLLPSYLSYQPCVLGGWGYCPGGTDHKIQVNTVAVGQDSGVDTALLTNIKNYFAGTGATYNITTNVEDLKQFFIQSLDEIYQMNLASSGPSGTEFTVDPNNRKLVVILSWTTPASAVTFSLQQKTTPGDTWKNVACTTSATENTTVGYAICIVNNPLSGTWRAVNGMGTPVMTADRQFALLDLNLRARFAIDQKVHGTGRDVILTADLNEAGAPVAHDPANHPVKVTVIIKRPGEGFGTYVSTHTLERCEPSSPTLPPFEQERSRSTTSAVAIGMAAATTQPSSGDPKSPRFEKIDALFKLCQKEGLIFVEDPGIDLYDDGTHGDVIANDGIYTLRFTNTQYEGSYVFRFKAEGISPMGSAFSRVKTIAEYLRVEVDPSETVFSWREYQQSGTIVVGQFYVTPRDKFKGYLGPGYPEQIQFQTTAGSFIGPVTDHNNGIYSQLLRYDTLTDRPVVTAAVQDMELTPIKVFKAFEVVPFVGYFFFDSALGLDDGAVAGARLGYRVTNQFALELEGAVTFTEDTAGDSGHVYQAMANVRYDLYSLRVRRLVPYVTAGAGYVFFRGFGMDDEAPVVHGGVGSTLELGNSFGIRVDGRIFQIGSAMNAGSTTNLQVTGGLLFRF